MRARHLFFLAIAGGLSAFCKSTTRVVDYLADGSACNADYECKSDQCLGGVCVMPSGGIAEIGQPCPGLNSCVADATCQDGICVAMLQACGGVGDGCENTSDCCEGACSGGQCSVSSNGTGGAGGSGAGGSNNGCVGSGQGCDATTICCNGACDSTNVCP